MERWHCEEAEIRAEKVLEDSKKDLLEIIEMWAISKRLEAFFADAERRLEDLPEVEREHAMENVTSLAISQPGSRGEPLGSVNYPHGTLKRRNTMAMNRIQFQPGLSLTEFLELYGTQERCEQALERARWPDGYRCEHCESTHHCIVNAHGRKTYQCHHCHHQTTLKAGTIFHASKLPLVRWFQPLPGHIRRGRGILPLRGTATHTGTPLLDLAFAGENDAYADIAGICAAFAKSVPHRTLRVFADEGHDLRHRRHIVERLEKTAAFIGSLRRGTR